MLSQNNWNKSGEKIALIAENSIQFVDILLNIWKNKCVAVLIDWRIPTEKIDLMLKEAGVKRCYSDLHHFEKLLKMGYDVLMIEKSKEIWLQATHYNEYEHNYSSDEAVVLYSSGTTGKAKGVVLTHYDIETNSDHIIEYMKLKENDVIYITKSLIHSSTLVGELLVAMKSNIKCMISPTIVPVSTMIRNIKKYNITIMGTNPSLLNMLCKVCEKEKVVFESLNAIYVSGSLLKDNLYNKAKQVFNKTKILNVYGLTECGPRVAAQRINENNSVGSVGIPIEGTEIQIRNEYGDILERNKAGMVWVKSKSLFKRYITMYGENNKDEYFCTNDRGYINNKGELFILGRADDMIICGAHNVFPEDIECVIAELEEIDDNVVIGVDDEIYGQKIVCLYEISDDRCLNIREHCMNRMPIYEIPHSFIRVEKIPYNSNGKKLRKDSINLYYELKKKYEKSKCYHSGI